jgi:glycosyltransferase involved in cell wall biosynthesis
LQGGFDAVWVHGYSTVNSLRAILSASLLKVPVLLRAESTLNDRERTDAKMLGKDFFFRLLREHVAAVLPIGTANARYWRHHMGAEVPSFSMPYAVDNSFFERKAAEAALKTDDLRRELGLGPGRPVILFASKLMPRKRCGDLLSAWMRVNKQHPDSAAARAYAIIIGDGEERGQLEEWAVKAGAGDGIRFLGFKNQTELPAYFALCDVFVLPSIHEPWGLVVNEAMCAARAVVVSDQVGCQEDLVRDGVNGRVFPAGDIDALAGALADVLSTPGKTRAMGQASLEIIRQHGFEQDVSGLRQALAASVPGFPVVATQADMDRP